MESDNVLADKMKVGRPELIKQLTVAAIGIVAKTCYIIGERVKPYIYNMPVIEIYQNSPLK